MIDLNDRREDGHAPTASSLADAMRANDITPPPQLIADGKLHRFHVQGDKARSENGWYVLHDDPPAGAYGDWKRGINRTWSGWPDHTLTDAEKARHKANMAAAKAAREADQARRHAEAAETAKTTWAAAAPADPGHPYLQRKKIQPHGARTSRGDLVLPLHDGAGSLRGLQFIKPDGEKKYLTGTSKAGNYYLIGEPTGTLIVAEGFATAASIHEATGHPVAVAFDANNLKPVALALRAQHPAAKLIIAGDNDESGVGQTAAQAAAKAAGGVFVVPPRVGMDFNDLAVQDGPEAVRGLLNSTVEVQGGDVSFDDLIVSFDDLDKAERPRSVIEKIVPAGEATLLAGHGGAGKSYVALVMAILVSLGRMFGQLQTTQCRVLFFSAEDNGEVLRYRVKQICKALGINPETLKGKLFLLDATDIDPILYVDKPTNQLEKLAAFVDQHDIGLTFIDNATEVFAGDEIRRVQVSGFIRALRTRVAKPDRAVVLIAHINKAAASKGKTVVEDYSGSAAWHNSTRSRMSLSPTAGDTLCLEHRKANHGGKAAPIKLEWVDGVPLVGGTFEMVRNECFAEILAAQEEREASADKKTLLAMMDDFVQRGETVPVATQGNCTAFGVLSKCDGFPARLVGKKDKFDNLMRAMERDGVILRTTITTKSRREKAVFIPAHIPSLFGDREV